MAICSCRRHELDPGLEWCWECRREGRDAGPLPEMALSGLHDGDEEGEDPMQRAKQAGARGQVRRLLCELLKAAVGQVVPQDALCQAIYHEPWEAGTPVAGRLKQLVRQTVQSGAPIETVRGQGWRWVEPVAGVATEDPPSGTPSKRPDGWPPRMEQAEAMMELEDERRAAQVIPIRSRKRAEPAEAPAAGTMEIRDRLDLAEALVHTGELLRATSDPVGGRRLGLEAERILREVAGLLGIQIGDGRESA